MPIVIGALVAPGARVPVLNEVPVAVCGTLSLFTQETVWPAVTVAGFGEYASAGSMLLMAMITSAAAGAWLGVGVGVDGETVDVGVTVVLGDVGAL